MHFYSFILYFTNNVHTTKIILKIFLAFEIYLWIFLLKVIPRTFSDSDPWGDEEESDPWGDEEEESDPFGDEEESMNENVLDDGKVLIFFFKF